MIDKINDKSFKSWALAAGNAAHNISHHREQIEYKALTHALGTLPASRSDVGSESHM